MKYEKEINRRRTFAIISHPDAGKTTLTEKLLLFGGAIQVAGAVKSNKIKKHATSDFMEIERQRGISVATSVMSFEYKDTLINLLDTPGHKDFAEDTYRTLTAVDSVILVIDSVNGVEEQITFPVRVMKALGVKMLIVSNAAGGMNTSFKVGDLMIIRDHINLFPEHPLRGPNDERLGTRFPDMSHPYDQKLIEKALEIAAKQDLKVHTGVYAGLTGPTFETKAEYKWLHIIGADAVGMSTVPEVIVAVHGSMQVFAASIITDMGIGDHLVPISHEEVLAAANEAAPKLAQLVTSLIATI